MLGKAVSGRVAWVNAVYPCLLVPHDTPPNKFAHATLDAVLR